MNLAHFPFDSQMCTVEIESFGYTMADLKYAWHSGEESVQMSPDVMLPQFNVLGHRQGWSEFWPGGFNHLVKTGLNHLILTTKSGQKWSKLTIWAFFGQKIVTNSKIKDIVHKESVYIDLLDVNTPIIWQKS